MKCAGRFTILTEDDVKFFGEGPCRLLRAVEQLGSLRAAAASMDMAYSKAVRIIRQAEEALGYPLTERAIGGRDGGGSLLTVRGKYFLSKYELWRNSTLEACDRQFQNIFATQKASGLACVIMASGLGRRFGSNKLMADFGGHPMIERILEASEGVFAQRIVVTRHDDIADLCRKRNIPVIRHDLPNRSDTIHLALAAIGGDASGCIFCPADQPLLRSETLQRFAERAQETPELILRLGYNGNFSSPVLFPAWCFEELRRLPAGSGGKLLIEKYSEFVFTIQASDPAELMDADTTEDLKMLSSLL